MKTAIASIIFSGIVLCQTTSNAPDGGFAFLLNSNQPNSAAFNNQTLSCTAWEIAYTATNLTSLSILAVQAPAGPVPGGWFTYAGSVQIGVNPNTNTVGAVTWLQNNTTVVSWFQLQATNLVGSNGFIQGQVYCWRANPLIGTITSFSSGNLSPLFNTTVSNPTISPSLAFTILSQNANLFYASPNGSSGNPTFRSILAADLPLFSSSASGIVPSSGGGTTNFLRADGSWAAPPGGGGGSGTINICGTTALPYFSASQAITCDTNSLHQSANPIWRWGPPESALNPWVTGGANNTIGLFTSHTGNNPLVIESDDGSALTVNVMGSLSYGAQYNSTVSASNGTAYGVAYTIQAGTGSALSNLSLYGNFVQSSLNNNAAIANMWYYYGVAPFLGSGTTLANHFGYYHESLGGLGITNPYYSWFDSQGVRRVKEDNTFNSVYQAIEALYNPQFTKYTPGAGNFERLILGQWESNAAYITTEAGGSGTLRGIVLDAASVTLGTASHKTILPSVSASTPLATDSSNNIVAATLQGNGSKVQMSMGSTTTNHCAKFDANGNTIDNGTICTSVNPIPPYLTIGSINYVQWDLASVTLPTAPTFINSVNCDHHLFGTNGDYILWNNAGSGTNCFGNFTASSSIEGDFGFQSNGSGAGGIYLYDSTNSLIWLLSVYASSGSTSNLIAIFKFSYSGSGNPAFVSSSTYGGAGSNVHYKIAVSGATATFYSSLNGGQNFITLATQSVGTISGGGLWVGSSGGIDVYSLIIN